MLTWSSEIFFHIMKTALCIYSLLQGFPSIKIFSQLICEMERRGKRNEDWLAKSFLCYDIKLTHLTCLL